MNAETNYYALLFIFAFAGLMAYSVVAAAKSIDRISITTSIAKSSGEETSNVCMLEVQEDTTLYMRPHKESNRFGVLSTGETVRVAGKTSNNWLGFDPASAQAANVGPFRLRYISPETKYVLSGNCRSLTLVPNLSPSTCFMMTQGSISIYEHPFDAKAKGSMKNGDYVPIVGSTTEKSYYKIDPSKEGTLPVSLTGWIRSEDLNMNGSSCGNLPVVS